MRGFPTDKFASDWLASTRWPHCPRWLRCDPGTGTRAGLQAHAIAPPSLPTPFLWGDGNGHGGLRAQLSDEANHHPVVGHRAKGPSSMNLHRVRGIREKTVWHVAHRIRETCERNQALFPGSAEVDQTFTGSKRPDMPKAKREPKRGCAPAGMRTFAGSRDRVLRRSVSASCLAAGRASFGNPPRPTVRGDHLEFADLAA